MLQLAEVAETVAPGILQLERQTTRQPPPAFTPPSVLLKLPSLRVIKDQGRLVYHVSWSSKKHINAGLKNIAKQNTT